MITLGRATALHALALLVEARQPLPEGLERLAASDPGIAPWARRLCPRLRSGLALPDALRAARVVSRRERRLLAAVPAEGVAAELTAIADGSFAPTPGYALVRWLPFWLALALVVPPFVFFIFFYSLSGGVILGLVREMGLSNRHLGVFAPLDALGDAAIALAVVAAGLWLVSRIRPLRHLLHLWCPEVHRAAALARLTRAAIAPDDTPLRLNRLRRFLSWCLLDIRRRDRPRWDLDWRTWMFLTRFRMTSRHRRMLRELPDLAERIGALDVAAGGDPLAAARQARERYLAAYLAARPLLVLALYGCGVTGWYFFCFAPILAIIQEFGGGM
jgi:hypothetical protein